MSIIDYTDRTKNDPYYNGVNAKWLEGKTLEQIVQMGGTGGDINCHTHDNKSILDDLTSFADELFYKKTGLATKALVDKKISEVQLTPGPKGDKGDTGAQGPEGPQGVAGSPGRDGVDGQQGLKGDKGDAFVYADFTPEQLASLVGPQGPRGTAGLQGPKGEKGDPGNSYTVSSAVDSDSEVTVATSKAVKLAMDKANQAFQSASDGKTIVASAITDKGVPTDADATFEVMATNIQAIQSGLAVNWSQEVRVIYKDTLRKGDLAEIINHNSQTIAKFKRDAMINPNAMGVAIILEDGEIDTQHMASLVLSNEGIPRVTSINPNASYVNEIITVTINGGNLLEGCKVYFGETEATFVSLIDNTLKVSTPANVTPGRVDIKVENTNGNSITIAKGFTFMQPADVPLPYLTHVNLSSTVSGEPLTSVGQYQIIYGHGDNFDGAVKVLVADTESTYEITPLNIYDTKRIRFRMPATVNQPGLHKLYMIDKYGVVNYRDSIEITITDAVMASEEV